MTVNAIEVRFPNATEPKIDPLGSSSAASRV